MKCILVVDDDPAVRSAFRVALEDLPLGVSIAEHGEDGLKKVKEEEIDVVFLDLKMPGIDGIETLRRMRARNLRVPVYIVTAFAEQYMEQLKEVSSEGLDFELLRKPLERDDIRKITTSILSIASSQPSEGEEGK